MTSVGFELIRSPGPAAWAVFWIYGSLMAVAIYYTLQVFKREQILFGHAQNVFSFLTSVRIWSLRHRVAYTGLVGSVLVGAFLIAVYWAEQLHYFFYGAEPLFVSIPDFLHWVTVLLGSGLEHADPPRSLLGIMLAGTFPLFLIGTVLSIVRFTSEAAHDSLIDRMARGDMSPYRVVIVNYQEKYDGFIEELLQQTDAFVVLLPKAEHEQDAASFKQSFEMASQNEYRVAIEELSYSTDLLLDQYSILSCDELYIFPDMNEKTEYRNLQLITTLNDEMTKREQSCPNVVWYATSGKIAAISGELDSSKFKRQLRAVCFQDDIDRMIRLNLDPSVETLNEHFLLDDSVPEWVTGTPLADYSFDTTPLTDDEREQLRQFGTDRRSPGQSSDARERQSSDARERQSSDARERQSAKRAFLDGVEQRVGSSAPFYGLLADAGGTTVPIDPTTAYVSQQVETATDAVQIRPGAAAGPKAPTGAASRIFVVNYNASVSAFLRSIDAEEVTVFCSEDQVTPETTGVRYVAYDTTTELLDRLFAAAGETAQIRPGDTLLLFLDHSVSEPRIDLLRLLNAIDEKLGGEALDVSHNDVFLGIESAVPTRNEEYRYLSVDKVIETFKLPSQYLHNLATLRNDDVLTALIREGKLDTSDAFDWAATSAQYLRQFRVKRASEVYDGTAAVVGQNHYEAIQTLRDYEDDTGQLFASFSIERPADGGVPEIDFHRLTPERTIGPDEYLLFLPYL